MIKLIISVGFDFRIKQARRICKKITKNTLWMLLAIFIARLRYRESY